ncbi:MAG: putative peptidoglycan glycosyltransferase FtsW [Alphaproteobacteria bacterium]
MSFWSRTDRSLLSRWWWTVDRTSLLAILTLAGLGLMLILASGPAVAARHVPPFPASQFITRQLLFIGPALGVLIGCSLLDAERIRRLAVPGFVVAFLLLVATLVFGEVRNGAQRWLSIAGLSLQPSEFLKPMFVLVLAGLLSARGKVSPAARFGLAFLLLGFIVLPLIKQPDFGQTALIVMTFGAMLFLAGLPIAVMAGLAGLAACGAVAAFLRVEHVADRVKGFLDPSSTDTYQVAQGLQAFRAGGLLGVGPGEGRLKWSLPDAHTDFIFAVAGEEFGVALCLVIVALIALIVVRALVAAMREEDPAQLAISGLGALFALQELHQSRRQCAPSAGQGHDAAVRFYGGCRSLPRPCCAASCSPTRRRITGAPPRALPSAGPGVSDAAHLVVIAAGGTGGHLPRSGPRRRAGAAQASRHPRDR